MLAHSSEGKNLVSSEENPSFADCGAQAVCSCVLACEMASFQPVLSFLRALLLLLPCPAYLTRLYLHSLTELQAVFTAPPCNLLEIQHQVGKPFGKGAFTLLCQMEPVLQLFFLKEGSLAMKAKALLATLAAEPVVNSQQASVPIQAFPFTCHVKEVTARALTSSLSALQAFFHSWKDICPSCSSYLC